MKERDIKFYLIGTIVVSLSFFTIVEVVTRISSWVGGSGFTLALHEMDPTDKKVLTIYTWHPFTGFILTPNTSFVGSHPNQKEKAIIYVNQKGFLIDPKRNLVLEKSPNEIRVATIGASTTANVGLNFDDNWPGQLGILLRKRFPKKKITIINASVPGYNTAQSIGNLALRVMPYKPDIVIIYHAYNDLKAVSPNKQFLPDYSHLHGTPYGYHKKKSFFIRFLNHSMFYVRIRNMYRKNNKAVVLKGKRTARTRVIPNIAKNTFEQHIQSMVGIARAGGAKVVLSSFATLHDPVISLKNFNETSNLTIMQKREIYRLEQFIPDLTASAIFDGLNRYNGILRKISINKKTGWVDNARLVPHKDKYFVDRVHFSKQGARLMAKNFLPEVSRLIRK